MDRKTNIFQHFLSRCLIALGLIVLLVPLAVPVAAYAADPPAEIEVYVLRSDGQEFGPYTISETDGWYLAIPDMEKFDGSGVPYTYTIVEVPIDGFTTNVVGQVDARLDDYYYMMTNRSGCIVTFDGNGGTVLPANATRTVAPGTALGFQMPPAPTRDGYVFEGWNTAANGSGSDFTASTVINTDITVYAQWAQPGDLPATYDLSGLIVALLVTSVCAGYLILAREKAKKQLSQ